MSADNGREPHASAAVTPSSGLRCPVCAARFRGTVVCSRCGADLARPMLIVAAAYRLRRDARRALASGDPSGAMAAARRSVLLHDTPSGRALLALAALATGPASGGP